MAGLLVLKGLMTSKTAGLAGGLDLENEAFNNPEGTVVKSSE